MNDSTSKSVGQQVGGISAVVLNVFSVRKGAMRAKLIMHLHKVSLYTNYREVRIQGACSESGLSRLNYCCHVVVRQQGKNGTRSEQEEDETGGGQDQALVSQAQLGSRFMT